MEKLIDELERSLNLRGCLEVQKRAIYSDYKVTGIGLNSKKVREELKKLVKIVRKELKHDNKKS